MPSTIGNLLKRQGAQGESNDEEVIADFILALTRSIKAAYADWQAALGRAAESVNQADAHSFRIRTKRLRYRIELAWEIGYQELRPQMIWLKALQDSLGEWHDREELARTATLALANPDFLSEQPRAASLLLKRLARERMGQTAKLKSLLSAVNTGRELQHLERWIASHSEAAASVSIGQHGR